MDMTQYAGSESKYLKAADLKGKNPTLVIERVELVTFENDGETKTRPAIFFQGKEKGMTLNPTNTEVLVQKFGSQSDDWIGKTVLLGTRYYKSFDKEGLVLTALDVSGPDDEVPF